MAGFSAQHMDAAKSQGGSVQLAAMGDIPVNVSEDAKAALTALAGQQCQCVDLTLDRKTEVLMGRTVDNFAVDSRAQALPVSATSWVCKLCCLINLTSFTPRP